MRTANAERHYEVTTLHDRHKEIIRLIAMGLANSQIAAELGVSTATVVYTKYSEVGQAMLTELGVARDESVKDISNRIKKIAPYALDTLEALMTSTETPEAVRAKIAMDNLDRAGLGVSALLPSVDSSLIDTIKNNARAAGILSESEPASFSEVSAEAEPISEEPISEESAIKN